MVQDYQVHHLCQLRLENLFLPVDLLIQVNLVVLADLVRQVFHLHLEFHVPLHYLVYQVNQDGLLYHVHPVTLKM